MQMALVGVFTAAMDFCFMFSGRWRLSRSTLYALYGEELTGPG